MLGRPAMGSDSTVLRSGRQGPPLPDTDLPQNADSNFSSNVPLEPSGTGYVEDLVRLQAEADFLLDLGGAAEDRLDAAEPSGLEIVAEQRTRAPAGHGRLHLVSSSRDVRAVRSGGVTAGLRRARHSSRSPQPPATGHQRGFSTGPA